MEISPAPTNFVYQNDKKSKSLNFFWETSFSSWHPKVNYANTQIREVPTTLGVCAIVNYRSLFSVRRRTQGRYRYEMKLNALLSRVPFLNKNVRGHRLFISQGSRLRIIKEQQKLVNSSSLNSPFLPLVPSFKQTLQNSSKLAKTTHLL